MENDEVQMDKSDDKFDEENGEREREKEDYGIDDVVGFMKLDLSCVYFGVYDYVLDSSDWYLFYVWFLVIGLMQKLI